VLRKLLLFAMLFIIFAGRNSGSDRILQSPILDTKSLKNWFAQDLKFNIEPVTMRDLLNSPGSDWLVYHGDYKASHYSPLTKIDRDNIKTLVPKWTYKINDGANLRSSPIISHGVMFVTAANEVHALDVSTGQWLWKWQAYLERSKGINRGIAIYENKIFFSTSDCQLVALNRETGNLLWSVKYVDSQNRFFSTMAPLVIKDKIFLGVANNNSGESGFVAAFSTSDGKELWRFQTLPAQTELRGAPTWLTGSYDPTTDTIYWAVGTLPDDQRANPKSYKTPGAYHDSIIALDAKNGRLKWSTRLAEYMPIDWDSNEPLVLTEMNNKNLLLQANRNGLFYSMDRITGKINFSKSFVKKIDWTNKKKICPSVRGATNWMPPSFSPLTGLFYVMTLEGCVGEDNSFYITALDPTDANIKWTYPTRGTNIAAPGLLATGGNIVLGSEGSGHMVALDAVTGKKLWDFSTGKPMFGAPVTYLTNGRQYITMVAGSDVYTFGLYSAR